MAGRTRSGLSFLIASSGISGGRRQSSLRALRKPNNGGNDRLGLVFLDEVAAAPALEAAFR
jgi:hypothetical protein